MVGGYNHNFRYKGRLFHVQTEDGGSKNPRIVTLLYEGGTVLIACKESYADQLAAGNPRQLVEQRMKEQHKQMLRRLRDGALDAQLGLAAAPPSTDGCGVLADPPGAESVFVSEPGPDDRAARDRAPLPEETLEKRVFAYLAGNDARYHKP